MSFFNNLCQINFNFSHATRQGTKDLVTKTTKCLKNFTDFVAKGGRVSVICDNFIVFLVYRYIRRLCIIIFRQEHKLQAERVRNEFRATMQRYDNIQKVTF